MQIQRAKSIDNLYGEVAEYDLVLTADAPLADGLNGRIDRSRLGRFATTPRRLVRTEQQNEDVLEKRDLFLTIVQEADVSWKQAMYFLDEIVDAWKHIGSLNEVAGFDRFDNDAARAILYVIRETENIFSRMEEYELSDDLDVAVIGEHQFNALDKQVLPTQYERIPVFTEDTEPVPEFKLFESSSDIVQSVVDAVSQENADDVAVIVDPNSAYPTLVESRLSAAGIPYMKDRTLAEHDGMRALLTFLQAALDRDRLRVGEVRPLLPTLNMTIPMKYDDKRLDTVDHHRVNDLQRLLSEVADGTFQDAVERLNQRIDPDFSTLRDVLNDLQLWEQDVTQDRVQRLEYYLSAFDDEIDKSRRGVLLASAKSSAYVDRPIVFYLGMGAGWTHDRRRKPWINHEQQERQRIQDFTILLQNGEQQHYLVQDREMNQDVTPCFYFNEIFDTDIETFRDLAEDRYGVEPAADVTAFEKEAYDVSAEEEQVISQSRLNKLVRCPREYFFDQLVPSVDKSYMTRGSLFHDFAEFYVNYPDYVQDHFEDCIDLMVEEMRPFLDTVTLQRSEFRIGCQTIIDFIDREGVEEVELDTYEKTRWGNTFADAWDMDLESSVTEMWFEDAELGGRGIVDLMARETHLVDHKSGKNAPSQRKIVHQSHLELFEDEPKFQAILYLAHHRRVVPDEALQFTFFHFLNNMGDVVTDDDTLDDNMASVTYYPRTFEEQLTERETFDFLDSAKKRKKLLEPLGFDTYAEIITQLDIPKEERYEKEALVAERLNDFIELCRPHLEIGRGKDVTENQLEKACKSILKKLVTFRHTHFFKEDLDAFEEFLQEQIADLNEYKRDGFPLNDANLDVVDHRDLIRQ